MGGRLPSESLAALPRNPASRTRQPLGDGYVESFNARLRDELLDGEIFYSLREAQIVIESWRRHYNTIRPHQSLGYKPPAPEVFVPAFRRGAGCARPTGVVAFVRRGRTALSRLQATPNETAAGCTVHHNCAAIAPVTEGEARDIGQRIGKDAKA